MLFEDIALLISQRLLSLIAAVITLIIVVVGAKILSKLVRRILHELELNKVLKRQGMKISLEEIIPGLTKYIIYFIGVILVLESLGLTTTTLNIIFSVILIAMILFVILAIKDFIPNIIAGIIIQHKRFIKKGDYVRVGTIEGIVIEITITETRLKTKDNDVVIIPNSFLTKNEIIVKG